MFSTKYMLVLYIRSMSFSGFQLFDEEMNNQCAVVLNDPKTMRVGAWNFTSCGDTHFLCVCQKPVGKSEFSLRSGCDHALYTWILSLLTYESLVGTD